MKKVSLEGDMKSLYESLGQLYFEKYADGDMPKEMAELCEKITSCQHAINEAEQRAAFLKGVVICSNCQAEVDKDASYCPKCGAEIIHVVEEDEDDSVDAEHLIQQLRNRKQLRMPGNQKKNLHRMLQLKKLIKKREKLQTNAQNK